MLLKATIVILVLFSLLGFQPQRTSADELQIIPILTPSQYIVMYADEYNVSEKQLLAVANCESSLKPTAIHYNDGGKGKHSVGLFQYQKSTFDTWSKIMGVKLDYYSYADQAKLAAFMFAHGQQKQWTCARELGIS